MHANAYEICYLADGHVDWWAEDRVYGVGRGQFYVTKPDELHGSVDATVQPSELYWIQVVFPSNGAFEGLTRDETRSLEREFALMRDRVFPASSDPVPLFQRMLEEMHAPSTFSVMVIRAAVHDLLTHVVRDSRRYSEQTRGALREPSPRIRRALTWIDEHLTEDFPIEDVARHAGIAVSHFYKLFAREVGFTPADYRTRQRIRRAKHMLRDPNTSITHIGLDLGFSSSQYFAGVFKNMTGQTPRDYRKRVLDMPDGQDVILAREPVYVD